MVIASQQTNSKQISEASRPDNQGGLARQSPAQSADVPLGSGTLPDVEQAVAISRDARGNLILRQQSWHDHETLISVSQASVAQFVNRLTDAVGIPPVG
jgi:hypothetical protein